jgi:hypothetical protein
MTMRIAIVPALLLGLGARILFDHFSRFVGPSFLDFILFGAWQGIALLYAFKMGFGIIVAFGSASKLFIELNFIFDVARCVTILVGIALGVLFTDLLYQYFDKPPHSSGRKRKKHRIAKSLTPEIKSESSVQSRPREIANVETGTVINPAPNSFFLSEITAVDSGLGLSPSLTQVELGNAALFADDELGRCKEKRERTISQGDIAQTFEMKLGSSCNLMQLSTVKPTRNWNQ